LCATRRLRAPALPAGRGGASLLSGRHTVVTSPDGRRRLLDAQVTGLVTHGINGTTELTSNPGSFVVPVVLAHEGDILPAPHVATFCIATRTTSDSAARDYPTGSAS